MCHYHDEMYSTKSYVRYFHLTNIPSPFIHRLLLLLLLLLSFTVIIYLCLPADQPNDFRIGDATTDVDIQALDRQRSPAPGLITRSGPVSLAQEK